MQGSLKDVAKASQLNGRMVVGVWHRPNSSGQETTLDGVRFILDEFASAGINTVFVEAFHHGMTFFKNELIPYYRGYEDYDYGEYSDYLTAFVSEAALRDIEVHAWVQNFYIGVRDEVHFALNHPDWILKNQQGKQRHITEGQGFGGYIFLDPANPEVKDYLKRFYSLMLNTFPQIRGLNLDYIRYPVSIFEEGTDTGYTEISMRNFSERCGLKASESIDDFNKTIKENGLIEKWVDYRAEYITDFVIDISKMVRENHPGVILSTAVFSELDEAYYKKKQNVRAWIAAGALDMLTPMVYSYDAAEVRARMYFP